MALAAPEHQEMNGQVEVTWRTLHKVAHSLMVHARVSEVYVRSKIPKIYGMEKITTEEVMEKIGYVPVQIREN